MCVHITHHTTDNVALPAVPNNVTILCDDSVVASGASTACSIVPRVGSQQVYSRSSDVTLSVSGMSVGGSALSHGGSLSSTNTSFGSVFGVTYSANESGVVSVNASVVCCF